MEKSFVTYLFWVGWSLLRLLMRVTFLLYLRRRRQFPVFALGDLELGLLDQLSEGVDHHVEEVDEEHEAEQGHGAGARVPHYHRVELVRLHEEEHRVEESDQSELV
eukprot:CAMPEP_0185576940 /NCGR_PEP_ID=MMETSP0434-20130131/7748_1 /TAXON_ID=626734 ORGANISM="Favella taraikaensis, Strain Fe Narragansett Bay" /NCGR_SAMPLE_ID=MMETSP0434 /ASSEMBLY_ACC=CAM_ASM_000379 /LENGTH=105 /DNA_ID=CAMNT_0028194337 /DNA_START=482 /DNA_END=798 /DNA_ORIENTATION=-